MLYHRFSGKTWLSITPSGFLKVCWFCPKPNNLETDLAEDYFTSGLLAFEGFPLLSHFQSSLVFSNYIIIYYKNDIMYRILIYPIFSMDDVLGYLA